MYIGAYIYYNLADELCYGAEYGFSDNANVFVCSMKEDVQRDHPGSTGYEGVAWRMTDRGMREVARAYVQKYWSQEYGS